MGKIVGRIVEVKGLQVRAKLFDDIENGKWEPGVMAVERFTIKNIDEINLLGANKDEQELTLAEIFLCDNITINGDVLLPTNSIDEKAGMKVRLCIEEMMLNIIEHAERKSNQYLDLKIVVNEQDILEARVFDDYVVKDAYFNFDVHNITGAGLDKTGVQKQFSQEKGYTIPYRCLLPEVKENLLLCGRNISGTHMAHSNFRVMPICIGIGEAAGVAAYISVSENRSLNDINAKEIREIIGI